jgi:hypothetical protein
MKNIMKTTFLRILISARNAQGGELCSMICARFHPAGGISGSLEIAVIYGKMGVLGGFHPPNTPIFLSPGQFPESRIY